MTKIAILYPAHFDQITGGAEIQVKYFCDACIKKGFEVHFIYEDKGCELKTSPIIAHPLKRIIPVKFLGKGWHRYRDKIYQQLEAISPDVIYTRSGLSWMGFAAKYSKEHNVKHIHALASDKDVQRSVFNKPFFPFFSIIESFWINYGLKNASLLIAQNDFQKKMLLNRFSRESVIVNQMTPLVPEESIIKDSSKIKILWVANFKDVKRPELFVELAELLAPYRDKVEMYMCGRIPGNYHNLQKEVESVPWLKCLGPLSQEDVFRLMTESHILVNTSKYEGFSNTFVQAWMRKMVVVSMNSNPSNIITDKCIGFVCPDMSCLKQTVEQLLGDVSRINMIGEKAYKYAIANHGLENNISKIMEQI